jgi:hypothetical protein
MQPKIYLAFRFHGNFYHSYRGDTPDELGFGKDIRIIRHLIKTLDELNAQDIPVRGTWDFENYFSLEQIMPKHCPDIIADLQRRVRDGEDEMQLMSYNNGLINAHTAGEFEAAIRRGLSNANGSGVRDLFGEQSGKMVRPQEMMYTPIHLKLYKACGVEAISLFYSALPFNGFSNFIPLLAFPERYNPLTLTYPGITESMTLMPCYNTGDLADHLTLRRWVKSMRRRQLALEKLLDLLLLIDMDADDVFWVGFDVPLLKGRFSTIGGLRGLVENIADLDYLVFTTPCRYLQNHSPLRSLTIGQDTADGSFDGLSSWTEKWSNNILWTGLERARILELQTRRLLQDGIPYEIKALLDESFEARLQLLSTTHFGMAAPVMNLTRERVAGDLARRAVGTAAAAFDRAATSPIQGAFGLLDYVRGDSTDLIQYQAKPSRSLLRLPLRAGAPAHLAILDEFGQPLSSAILITGLQRELLFVDSFEPAQRKNYSFTIDQEASPPPEPVLVTDASLQNEFIQLDLDQQRLVTSLTFDGDEFANRQLIRSSLVYAGKQYEVQNWRVSESLSLGIIGLKRLRGDVTLKAGYTVRYELELMLAAGLPYLYITMRAFYPRTPDQGFDRGQAVRLQQAWDNAWQAVMPCEIYPSLAGTPENSLRVLKHNFCDHISNYSLDYGRFSKNVELDAVNNQITHAWVAVSDGRRGLLLAQSADATSSAAFCPMRTRREGNTSQVMLNPFGTYWGRQYHYGSGDTGLGNLLAVRTSASGHIKPYAPSYNGRIQEFSLLLAPYHGDVPPESIRNDAEAFAYPYLLLNDDRLIAAPAHRNWDSMGIGELSNGLQKPDLD